MNKETENKKRLKHIYYSIIVPKMKKYLILRKNICEKCANRTFNPYGMDTGICSVCNETNEVVNEFLYDSILELKFKIVEDWYGNIPRLYDSGIK